MEKYALDFSGTEVPRVDLDDNLAGLGVNGLLIDALTAPPANGSATERRNGAM